MVCSQDIWSSKECSGNQNVQKNSSDTNQLSSWLGNPHLAFFKMDEKFHPIIWFLKRKLHSITVCEIGRETIASTANEKWKTSPPTVFHDQEMCTLTAYGPWPNQAKNLVLMPTICKLLPSRKRGETFLVRQPMGKGSRTWHVASMPTIHTIYICCGSIFFWLKTLFPFILNSLL